MNLDEEAIARLYERYGHALFRRCRSLVGNEEDAHELLQETFCQFWQGRHRFARRSSAFTFLYRIATNLSIDRLRRRRTAGVHQSWDEGAVAVAFAGERRTLAASELAELTQGLSAETLTMAVMAHVDGMTQDEIALALGVSRRTVGKRLKHFKAHARGRVAAASEGRKATA